MARKRSLRADILRPSRLLDFGVEPVTLRNLGINRGLTSTLRSQGRYRDGTGIEQLCRVLAEKQLYSASSTTAVWFATHTEREVTGLD